MTIKSLLFILFLSLCLVWAAAGYWHAGPDMVRYGLLWTILVVGGVLAFIILARLFGLWRVWRARAASRPAALPKPAPVVHEDDAAFAALIAEANAALSKSANYTAVRGKPPLSQLPLFLLIGPAGAGKTSTFLNSGIEPQLLAGDAAGSSTAPTRLGNIWLAKNAVFLEISGRAFGGDIARWTALLAVIQGRSALPLWRRLWREPDEGQKLQGVIGFCDVKELAGAAGDPQRLERSSREWQERLMAIGEVFGTGFPVYQVLTKCDALPFFSDFFSRLPESEVNQILGCTLPFREAEAERVAVGFAEAEAKRLTGAFRPLYHSLAERRIGQLAHEPNPARKPGIYEFPRELKRIRAPLVQFLTDAFRPNPLRPAPVLRGFYLTAVQEVEVAVATPLARDVDSTNPNWNLDTTRLFRGDATQIFSPGEPDRAGVPRNRKGMRNRWIFVSDLIHQVVLADRPLPRRSVPRDLHFERVRQVVLASVCGVCVLLCCAFVTSWARNRNLLNDLSEASHKAPIRKQETLATLADLQALDGLRGQVDRLEKGESLRYRWGLYTGNKVLDDARKVYFARFQELLLRDLNEAMLVQLRNLTSTPSPDDPDQPAYDFLKTHLMISSGACKPDRDLAARTLKKARGLLSPDASAFWQELADRQIDFYAAALNRGNPGKLLEDVPARDHARQYLAGIKNTDRVYQAILAAADKSMAPPKQLSDLAPNYKQVLTGDGVVRPVFTQAAWAFVQNASKKANGGFDDACVMPDTQGLASELKQGSVEKNIQQRYLQAYIDQWRNFLTGFSVIPYRSAGDAADRLKILSAHDSPLLAIMALTADQTNFSEPVEKGLVAKGVKKVGDLIGSGEKNVQQLTGAEQHQLGILDITHTFQPVQYVVPAGSDHWIYDKNNAYIDGLAKLQGAIQALARAPADAAPDPQAGQAAVDNAEAALQKLQEGFSSEGVGGVDREVGRLLEEPIKWSRQWVVPPSPDKKITGDVQKFCVSAQQLFSKYPFNSTKAEGQSNSEVSLKELHDFFAPEEGAVWKLQKSALAELTVLEGGVWKAKPDAKVKPSQDLIDFLNRAQKLTKAFFADSSTPHLTYSLRPVLASGQLIRLAIDGQSHDFTAEHQMQHLFAWPGSAGAESMAEGRSGLAGSTSGFGSHSGLWAVFRFFGDAVPREPGAIDVEWKDTKGGSGRPQPLDLPAQLEFAGGFPGGVDVFNPKFFAGFHCPLKPIQ